MASDKAARLQAIRAANAQKAAEPSVASAATEVAAPVTDKAARLAAIRAANAQKAAEPSVASAATEVAAPVTDKAARLAAARAANAQKATAPTADKSAVSKSIQPNQVPAEAEAFLTLGMRLTLGLLFVVVLGLLIVTALAIWQPIVNHVMPAVEPGTFMSLSRSSALVSYVLLWLSMALGLAISTKVTRLWPGGPAAIDLHQYLSLLGLLLAALHVIVLLGDTSHDFTFLKAFTPLAGSSYRPMWVGLMGKFALYFMAVIVASFYLRSRIGGRWWRRLHYLSFAVFVLSLLHGLFAGSDTPNLWAQLLYLATAGSLVGLTIYRIRRSLAAGSSAPKLLRAGTLSFDPASRVVTLANNRQVTLRSIEARLLHYLLEHSGQALTVDQILVNIWGQHYLNEPELVAIYIRRLRDRIEHDPSNPHYVRNAQMGAYLVEG